MPLNRLVCSFVVIAVVAGANTAHAAVSRWVDIRIDNGQVLLDSRVAGIEGVSLVDTGAQVTAINSRFLAAHSLEFATGPAIRIQGVFGEEDRRTFLEIPVELFGSKIDFRELVDLNFGGPEQQLLLGAGFLREYIFQFDYPNKRMRIITRDALDMKKLKNVESRSDPKSGDPIVRVQLNKGKKVWLLLDMGSTGGLLLERHAPGIKELLAEQSGQLVDSSGATTTGELQQFTMPELGIGPFDLGNVEVSVPPEGQSLTLFKQEAQTGSHFRARSGKYRGILGYDVLKHFVLTIDYRRGYVHLEPGAPAQPQ